AGPEDHCFARPIEDVEGVEPVVGAAVLQDRPETAAMGGEVLEVHEQIDDDEQAHQAYQAEQVRLDLAEDHLAIVDGEHAVSSVVCVLHMDQGRSLTPTIVSKSTPSVLRKYLPSSSGMRMSA